MILDVFKEKQKIDHVFDLANHIEPNDELLSHWAKYLCVLTSGFIENSLRLILIHFVEHRASPQVLNFVESRIRSITNLNEDRVAQLLGAFSYNWRDRFSKKRTQEQKDAIDSVIANRHLIVHGRSVELTLARMRGYYTEIVKAITIIDEECVNNNT